MRTNCALWQPFIYMTEVHVHVSAATEVKKNILFNNLGPHFFGLICPAWLESFIL